MKNSSNTIGNRTCDLPACSALPQPTAPPRAASCLAPCLYSRIKEAVMVIAQHVHKKMQIRHLQYTHGSRVKICNMTSLAIAVSGVMCFFYCFTGQDNVVGIATFYGLGSLGVETYIFVKWRPKALKRNVNSTSDRSALLMSLQCGCRMMATTRSRNMQQ